MFCFRFIFIIFFHFERTHTPIVVQAGLELITILLPQLFQCVAMEAKVGKVEDQASSKTQDFRKQGILRFVSLWSGMWGWDPRPCWAVVDR